MRSGVALRALLVAALSQVQSLRLEKTYANAPAFFSDFGDAPVVHNGDSRTMQRFTNAMMALLGAAADTSSDGLNARLAHRLTRKLTHSPPCEIAPLAHRQFPPLSISRQQF